MRKHSRRRSGLTFFFLLTALGVGSASHAQQSTFALWNGLVNGRQLDEAGVVTLAQYSLAELELYDAYVNLCHQLHPEPDAAAAELKAHVDGLDDAIVEFVARYTPAEIAAFETSFDASTEQAFAEQKAAFTRQFPLEDREARLEACTSVKTALRQMEPAVVVARQKGDAEYQQRLLEEELADKYSPELVTQALSAEYPSFGLPTPSPGSEEAFYGRNHPLRAKLRPGRELLSLIRNGRYDEVETYFTQFQQAFISGTLPEKVYADAFQWAQFSEARNDDLAAFDAWIAADPDSWLPQAMRGLYATQMLWTLRGSGFANEIPEESADPIAQYLAIAEKSLSRALELNPDFLAGHYALLGNAKLNPRANEKALFDSAATHFPASFQLRWIYLTGLEPRWGGSRLEMRIFALDSQRYASANPRLQTLLGMEIIDEAEAALAQDDVARARALFAQVQLHGVNGSQLYRLANLLEQAGERGAAVEHWEYVLRHVPGADAVSAGKKLASHAFSNADRTGAWQYLAEAVAQAPAGELDEGLLSTLALLDGERAAVLLSEQLAAHPESPGYHYQLAYLYQNMQDSRTTSVYRQFLSLCAAGSCQAAQEENARQWLVCINEAAECALRRPEYDWALLPERE